MSLTVISTINYAIQQISVYYAIPIMILGVVGSSLNIIVFLSSRTFRQKSCIFYLIIMSFLDLGRYFSSVLPNILSWGFQFDLSLSSLIFCKTKTFIFSTCSLGSITCLCLAIIDQYFATSTRPSCQKWCNIKLAYRLTSIFLIIWTLHGIPYFLFYNHIKSSTTNKTICQITNDLFIQYHLYGYFLILTNLLPLIAVVFGLMAYWNARRLTRRKIPFVRRELDKQLTKMVLVQITIYMCTFLPYSIQCINALIFIHQNDPVYDAKMRLTSIITLHISILSYATSFYTFVCVSRHFRRQLRYILYDIYFPKNRSMQLTINEEIVDE